MQRDFSIQTQSPEQTRQVGACLASVLVPPVTLALQGDLGAGKTCLVTGLVQAFTPGVVVRSPTYALAHSYETRPTVHHVDLYRVQNLDLLDLGIENLLDDPVAIICVEWPEHGQNPLPKECIQLAFAVKSRDVREIKFSFTSYFSDEWVLTLKQNLLSLFSNAG